MAESIEQLSFELTASELAEQERAVSGLRTGAGTVIAAASVAGSFIAARTDHSSLNLWCVLAMVAFALCVGSAIWVLLPHTFVFAFRGERLLAASDGRVAGGDLQGAPEELTEAYRAAGAWIAPYIQANRRKVSMLADWLTASCILLAAEVVLWTLSIAG